jgi:hypothetical protein
MGEDRYTVARAAERLGVGQDAVRKRVGRGDLSGDMRARPQWVDGKAVEQERTALLRRLGAIEPGLDPMQAPLSDILAAELSAVQSALRSMLIGARALHEADTAHLDALQQVISSNFPSER